MKKSLIPLIGLTLAVAVAGIVAGFTLNGGSGPPAQDLTEEITHGDPTYDEWILDFGDGIGDGKVLTSADDIDPNVCHLIHNLKPCTPEELDAGRNLFDNVSREPQGSVEPGIAEGELDHGDGKVVTSIDDIDPDECNAVHNYNACTVEELEELGNLAAISWIVDPGTEVLPTE